MIAGKQQRRLKSYDKKKISAGKVDSVMKISAIILTKKNEEKNIERVISLWHSVMNYHR